MLIILWMAGTVSKEVCPEVAKHDLIWMLLVFHKTSGWEPGSRPFHSIWTIHIYIYMYAQHYAQNIIDNNNNTSDDDICNESQTIPKSDSKASPLHFFNKWYLGVFSVFNPSLHSISQGGHSWWWNPYFLMLKPTLESAKFTGLLPTHQLRCKFM